MECPPGASFLNRADGAIGAPGGLVASPHSTLADPFGRPCGHIGIGGHIRSDAKPPPHFPLFLDKFLRDITGREIPICQFRRNEAQMNALSRGTSFNGVDTAMRVLIADDHDLVRDTLKAFLDAEGPFQTDTVASFDEAEARVKAGEVYDLVLLDYSMPGMAGLDGLKRMQAHEGAPRVAIISGTANRDIAEEMLANGAAGFLPKTLSAKSLVNAVRFMAMGEQYAPLDFMRAAEEAPAHPLADQLSKREMEVLEGLTQGKSNKEIARDLDIREPTVKLHMKTLYRKIGASNRTQAAIIAKDAGLF